MIIQSMDSIARTSLLFDFYGGLLTEKQRQVMEFYHEENLSLAEIAEEFGISKQGVHDTLKKAEKALNDYEEKLGLVERLLETRKAVSEIDRKIDEISLKTDDRELADGLKEIKNIIDRLND